MVCQSTNFGTGSCDWDHCIGLVLWVKLRESWLWTGFVMTMELMFSEGTVGHGACRCVY